MHIIIIALSLIFFHFPVYANDQSQPYFEQSTMVAATLDSSFSKSAVINQQVILSIDVKTSSYFLGGTVLEPFSIPGVVVTQRNRLASNYTEQINGHSWTVQRWEFTLYPFRAGVFVVPQIPVTVIVADSDGHKMVGQVASPSMEFAVSYVRNKEKLLALSQLDIKQDWQFIKDDSGTKLGVERTISINAKDTLSIMLPSIDMSAKSSINNQIYCEPEVRTDSHVRGDYLSSIRQSCRYMFDYSVEQDIPDISITWWSTKTNQTVTTSIAGKQFTLSEKQSKVEYGLISGAIVLGIGAVFFTLYLVKNTLFGKFLSALIRKDFALLLSLIYQKNAILNRSTTLCDHPDQHDMHQLDRFSLLKQPEVASRYSYLTVWFNLKNNKRPRFNFSRYRAIPELRTLKNTECND